MTTTASELLMRNFNEIFIELDPVKRAALLAKYYTEDCLWIHPGGHIVGRDGINAAASVIRKNFPGYSKARRTRSKVRVEERARLCHRRYCSRLSYFIICL